MYTRKQYTSGIIYLISLEVLNDIILSNLQPTEIGKICKEMFINASTFQVSATAI